ncbi:hypothetical protein BCR36DRAFT_113346 [Piromyces finnis]|uniref:Uncharacterized protein n=1 Tax=Piromyces finnis TaxID=1754191 RepID=A0A1Y1VL74_9FUNG|nr:hypothetical protein BCR36DRAFT_113346 [Piromyces finnis]|eukprot:ORX58509.1 hypothetical protein BCR36DRAFT_113346 [Piromyces finnis]
MKSVLTKAEQPHITKFDKVCFKCTPNGYDENFPLQYNGLTCKIHKEEQGIKLICKFCKKEFNIHSYIFHNTSKKPCEEYEDLKKHKKTQKTLSSIFNQKYAVDSILKDYYEGHIYPKDIPINKYFEKLKCNQENNDILEKLINNFFKFQEKLSHNYNDNDKIESKNITKLVGKYTTDISKFTEIINKTQRYNTRRKQDMNTEICNCFTKKEIKDIDNTMDNLNSIIQSEISSYSKRIEDMKKYNNSITDLISYLIEERNEYIKILQKQNEDYNILFKKYTLFNFNANKIINKKKSKRKNQEINENDKKYVELKKKKLEMLLNEEKNKKLRKNEVNSINDKEMVNANHYDSNISEDNGFHKINNIIENNNVNNNQQY